MSSTEDHNSPGFFHIISQPKPGQENVYHEWYNTEHGPLRMRLDFFRTGYRYKSIGVEPPQYVAVYEMSRIGGLQEPEYTILREQRSEYESDLIENKLICLDRKIYKDVSTRGASKGPAPLMMAVAFVVKDEHVPELHKWYEEEHTGDLSKIPGWRRTRRFQLVEGPSMKEGHTELLAVHDFDQENGVDGPEHEFAKSRPWRMRVMDLVEGRDNRRFEFFHEFHASDYRGPPRLTNGKASTNLDWPANWHIKGPVGAPVVVFSNSLITDQHIWDVTIEKLSQLFPEYRYLVYNTRGYSSEPAMEVTIDSLTDDLAQLLCVLQIESFHTVVGVSLGGVTALNFAIRYPHMLKQFVACDCNVASSEANTKAWKSRQDLGRHSWDQLAQQTVDRWFATGNAQSDGAAQVRKMILEANYQGFVRCSDALCKYDLTKGLGNVSVPGLLVAGAEDGALPEVMKKFSSSMPACSFTSIPDAGHLPMLEAPEAFVAAIRWTLWMGQKI